MLICLFAICISSLVKYMFISLIHFLLDCGCFFIVEFQECFIYSDINPFTCSASIFFQSVAYLPSLNKIFHRSEVLNFDEALFFLDNAFDVESKNFFPSCSSQVFPPIFLKVFLCFMFKSMIHFDLIFI